MNHDFTLPHEKLNKKPKKPNTSPNLSDVKFIIDAFNNNPAIGEIQWKDFKITRVNTGTISHNQPVTEIKEVSKTISSPIENKPTPEPKDNFHKVLSPMVGTCYLAPSPEADNFTEVNRKVKAGDTICLIEAMKMFNKIKAGVSGTIKRRLIDDGDAVEFGQILFEIDETGE